MRIYDIRKLSEGGDVPKTSGKTWILGREVGYVDKSWRNEYPTPAKSTQLQGMWAFQCTKRNYQNLKVDYEIF